MPRERWASKSSGRSLIEVKKETELPPIGVGINYGNIGGRGAAGARFFGEGVVNISSSSSSNPPPFNMKIGGSRSGPSAIGAAATLIVSPGTLNGLLAENYEEAMTDGILIATSGIVCLDARSDGRVITSFRISTQSKVTPAVPTSPLAPFQFFWPIGIIEQNQGNAFRVYRLIGNASLVARAYETARELSDAKFIAHPGYVSFYTWTVGTNIS